MALLVRPLREVADQRGLPRSLSAQNEEGPVARDLVDGIGREKVVENGVVLGGNVAEGREITKRRDRHVVIGSSALMSAPNEKRMAI